LLGLRSYLLLSWVAGNLLCAQTPSFNYQKLGSEEGLNNANIFSIAQHPNGLMYFTTQNGIYFYDGYEFRKLATDSLKSNALQGLAFRNDDELYLSIRDEGLATFNLASGAYNPDKRFRIKDNNADQFLVHGDFAYLLTSEIKLVMLNLKTGEVFADALKNTQRPNSAYCLYKTADDRVLVGRGDGIYEARNGKQVRLDWLANKPVYSLAEDHTGRLLVGSDGRIFALRGGRVESEIVPVFRAPVSTFQVAGERTISKIVADKYGRIWFTAFPEENLFLLENNNLYDVFSLLDIPPTLVRSLYMDNQQNIWLGTFSDGVYFIQNTFFNTLTFTFNNKNLNINHVLLSGELLLAATSNGLYGMTLGSSQAKVLSHPDELFLEPVNGVTELNGAYYYTKRSQISVSPSIFMNASRAYRFKPVIARQFYPTGTDRSIVADWDANILVSNGDGSATLDTLISFTDYRIAVNALLKVADTLFIATSNGLYRYDFSSRKHEVMIRRELNFHINDLAMIGGKLYAAHEAGITEVHSGRLIQRLGHFRLNAVKRMRSFSDQIWLATLDGVYICDQELKPLKTIDKSNGLLSNSVNDISFGDRHVAIATARGVSVAEFGHIIRYNSRLKPVSIAGVSWNANALPVSAGSTTLGPDQEDITVNFYSPFFPRPNRQSFQYSLDGGEWVLSGALPQVNLALRGGAHELKVRASSDNILWSDPAELRIYKQEKITEKASVLWLAALGIIGLLLVVGIIIVRRVKMNARRRLLEEQQVNLLKHQAMNALLSPHFIFNSLTSIQNYINTNNSLKASEYLAKFSRLIRMIIEKAAQGTITLHDELARLTYYLELEKERFKNKFNYTIHIDDNINTHLISIPNMIIQPHVENCILHGILPAAEGGKLEIFFHKPEDNRLQIIIQDDGIGLIKAADHAKTGHKSLGISTIKDILEINSKLSGRRQKMTMVDRSTLDPSLHGTVITIELEL
jgi:ligand-binding sensor domain-containing protein